MKKLIISTILLLLLAVISVSAAGDLTIESVTVSPTLADPGDTVTVTVSVKNVGNDSIGPVTFSSSELEYNNKTINVPAIPSIASLDANESKSVSFDIVVPSTLEGTYQATLNATAGSETETETYSLTVQAKDDFTISEDSVDLKGTAGDTVSTQVTIKNTGSTELTNFAVSYTGDSQDNDGDELTFSSSGAANLAPGESFTLNLEMELDNHLDIGSYAGIATISAQGTASISKNATLTTEVEPKVCKYGELGDLQVKIENPDEGEEFKPGEEINIEAEVDNAYTKDLYVYVKAYLYNMDEGKEVESASSEYVKVKDGDSEKFELSLKVPSDVDENDKYRLYVKAYKKGGEDEHCIIDSIDIDIEREEDSLAINDLVASKTEGLKAGEEIAVTVDVQNTGTADQEDVIVELSEPELGINVQSEPFELSEYGEDDDSYVANLRVKIPEDAKAGEYKLKVYLHYASEKDVAGVIELKVTEGGNKKSPGGITVTPENSKMSVKPGQKVALPILIENKGEEKAEFTLDVTNTGLWSKVIGIESPKELYNGDVYHAYVYIQVKEDAELGVHDLRINLRNSDGLLQSKLVSFTVEGSQSAEEEAESTSKVREFFAGRTIWIIGDIVLLIVALIFLRALFKK